MDTPHDRPGRPNQPAQRPAGDSGAPLRLYRPGQGQIVRWATAAAAGILAVTGSMFVADQLRQWPLTSDLTVRSIAVVLVLVAMGVLTWWLVGIHKSTVEFMIATEGEMKKVNWTTTKELIGATKVVILMVLLFGALLFTVDLIFMFIFSGIGVLDIDIGRIFRGSAT